MVEMPRVEVPGMGVGVPGVGVLGMEVLEGCRGLGWGRQRSPSVWWTVKRPQVVRVAQPCKGPLSFQTLGLWVTLGYSYCPFLAGATVTQSRCPCGQPAGHTGGRSGPV